jgi:hypothetical protein
LVGKIHRQRNRGNRVLPASRFIEHLHRITQLAHADAVDWNAAPIPLALRVV